MAGQDQYGASVSVATASGASNSGAASGGGGGHSTKYSISGGLNTPQLIAAGSILAVIVIGVIALELWFFAKR